MERKRTADARSKAGVRPSARWGGQSDLLKQLGRSRQELILPVLEHPREYVLLRVRELAHRLKRDPATLVRTIRALGFGSYRQFQEYIQELSIANATPLDLMQTVVAPNSGLPAYARESLQRDIRNLHSIRDSLDSDFKRVIALARKLYSARWILILSGDQAANLGEFLAYALTIIGLPAFSLVTSGRVVHTVRNVTAKDVVIAISYGRGLRQTVEGLKEARDNRAYCVAITDTPLSPLTRYSHEYFISSVESPSYTGSYVAPMALLNVIIVTCANYRRARTMAKLKKAEEEQRTGVRWFAAPNPAK
jgi:DNA-binding MurR/RpiR family transcriptional regulator